MESHQLTHLTSKEQFDELIKKTTLTVVHFYADWAVECEPMNNVLLTLSKQDDLKDVNFAKIAAETFPQLSINFKISAVPTFLLFVNGKQVDRLDGANAVKLTQMVKSNCAKAQVLEAASAPLITSDVKQATTVSGQKSEDDLNARLKKLINQSAVVLFMKGSAVIPQCGFSRQAVALLKELQAEFTTFDIFQDEEIRQGLKAYSNWPTYPQLYINGELIGGLDIMKEMAESGELGEMLNRAKAAIKTESLNERLKRITHQAPLMVFMKGDTNVPRCGFSRQLVEILNETKLPYETFDILNDEEVRQGLKTYSNWPTYPQVYVKGELVGGLDIIKELKENGELLSTLQGQ